MNINGKSFLESFRANVVSFVPTTMRINNNIFESDASYLPIQGEQQLRAQERELIVDFTSEEDISNMTVEFQNESTIDIDDGYIYRVWLKENPSISEEAYGFYTVSYHLFVIKQKPMQTISNYKDFTIIGNITTGVILEISATENLDSVKVGDYAIRDLKADDTLIIDGINMLVYYNKTPNISAFDDIDLMHFPKLSPGKQSIDCSSDKVSVVIKYYPTYM